jgi:hypothetical protein
MEIETKGLGAGSYPEPPETKEKHIKANVTISFVLEYDVPEDWDRDLIVQDIKENLNDFEWYDETIEEVEFDD